MAFKATVYLIQRVYLEVRHGKRPLINSRKYELHNSVTIYMPLALVRSLLFSPTIVYYGLNHACCDKYIYLQLRLLSRTVQS